MIGNLEYEFEEEGANQAYKYQQQKQSEQCTESSVDSSQCGFEARFHPTIMPQESTHEHMGPQGYVEMCHGGRNVAFFDDGPILP